MTIEYKILWVEDDTSWYETTEELFSGTIEELGFILNSQRCINIDEVKAEVAANNLKDYDLMLIDFTLGGSETGEKIIEFIRNIKETPILTDILFYSSAVQNVKDSMHKLGLEGVYFADRKDLDSKFDLVVNTTIKKVQDLNNMRGLIMAETSDIDKFMYEIISTTLDKDSFELRDKLKETIVENVKKKINSKNKAFLKYQSKDEVEKIIKDPLMFDACEKLKALQFIFEEVDHEVAIKHKSNGFADSYSKIVKKRNLLGHETPREIDGKKILGSGVNEFEFNDDFCVDMRKDVRMHAADLLAFLKDLP